MFVIEEGYAAGAISILYMRYPGDSPVMVDVEGSYNIPEVSPYNNNLCSWWIRDNANHLKWNRMADGALVGCNSAGVTGSEFKCLVEGMNQTSYLECKENNFATLESSSTSGVGATGMIKDSDAVIGGARYMARLFSFHNVSGGPSDYNKYLLATSGNQWNLTDVGTWTDEIITWEITTGTGISTYTDGISNGRYTTQSISASRGVPFRLVAIPNGSVPTLTPIETDLGIVTEPKQVTIQMAGTPTVTAQVDNGDPEPVSVNVGNFVIDLSKWWASLSYGQHTILCVAAQNGYKTGARITFNKSSSAVMVTTNPLAVDRRPVSCRLVGDIVVPSGAVLTQEVTNNGNDDAPTWESYAGTEHFFSNETKTASQWGLAARVSIDNSEGNAVAEIKNSLAMGVVYEEE